MRLSPIVTAITLDALEDAAAQVERDVAHALLRMATGDPTAEADADAAQGRLEALVARMGAVYGVTL